MAGTTADKITERKVWVIPISGRNADATTNQNLLNALENFNTHEWLVVAFRFDLPAMYAQDCCVAGVSQHTAKCLCRDWLVILASQSQRIHLSPHLLLRVKGSRK